MVCICLWVVHTCRSCLDLEGSCDLWCRLVLTVQWAPLVVPLCSRCADFEGLPPALGVSVFDLLMIMGSGGPCSTPVSWQSSAPKCPSCLLYTGRTLGVGPGGWDKPIELNWMQGPYSCKVRAYLTSYSLRNCTYIVKIRIGVNST